MRMPKVRFTVRDVLAFVVVTLPFAGAAILMSRGNSMSRIATTHSIRASFFYELSLALAGDPHAQEIAREGGYLPDDRTRVLIEGEGRERQVFCPPDAETPLDEPTIAKLVERCRRSVEYERELAIKYERVARFPWLTVAPDDPTPD